VTNVTRLLTFLRANWVTAAGPTNAWKNLSYRSTQDPQARIWLLGDSFLWHHSFRFARFDFACSVAKLIYIPSADEHFDLGYYLFGGRAPDGSVLLPTARFAPKLDEWINIVSHRIPLTMQRPQVPLQ